MAISLNTWYTTSDTGGSVKLTGGASSSYYQTRLRYKANSNNISMNKTNITVQLQVRTTSSSYNTYGPNQTTTIQGTALSAKAISSFSVNTWVTFGERTFDVEHNSDGSKTVTLSGSFTTTATTGSYGNYALKSGSVSTSVILPTIPRASAPTLSASSIAMGSSLTITTNRVSDSFTHTLTYSFGSASGTIANNVGASTTWTPPIDLANQIPSATSGTCTITCQTYNGSTLIGTKTVTVALTVPSSVVPSISSIALSEAGSTPSNWDCYVQNKSKLKVVTTASGSYGSSIKSYKITGIDSTTYASSNFTSNTLTGSGTKTITATVTDSRGRTATKTTTYTCVAYSNPSISNTSVARCNSDGTDNEEGTYVKYTFKASVSSVNSKNSHVFKIGYKETSSSTYTYVTIENDGYSLDKSNVVLSDITFSENSSYDFQFWVNDYFITTVAVQALGTGFTLMDFNASGKGMAIGKASEKDAFEVALDTEIYGTLKAKQLNSYFAGVKSKAWFHLGYFKFNSQGQYAIIECYTGQGQNGNADQNTHFTILLKQGWTGSSLPIGITTTFTQNYKEEYKVKASHISQTECNLYIYLPFDYTDLTYTVNGSYTSRNIINQVLASEPTTDKESTYYRLPRWTGERNTSDTYIPVANYGSLDYTKRVIWNSVGHTNYDTEQDRIATLSTLSYWNGAYNSSNKSNLKYCSQGEIAAKVASKVGNNVSGSSFYTQIGNLLVCWGRVAITPTANTPTSRAVTFPKAFSYTPAISVSALTTVPYTTVRGVSFADPSTTGFTAYVTRTNTTSTSLDWIAVGTV